MPVSKAAAMQSAVMSSCVGPMPPVEKTKSCRALRWRTGRDDLVSIIRHDARLAHRNAKLAEPAGDIGRVRVLASGPKEFRRR